MVRDRPAAHIMMGYFYAESLLLAETGATTGAIQIAGTDAFTQLPFFVTTCDYTSLGEELYAASAYLSREPKLLGSLKGQDVGKAIIIAVIIVGSFLSIFEISFCHTLTGYYVYILLIIFESHDSIHHYSYIFVHAKGATSQKKN